jgi:hypothetical protein
MYRVEETHLPSRREMAMITKACQITVRKEKRFQIDRETGKCPRSSRSIKKADRVHYPLDGKCAWRRSRGQEDQNSRAHEAKARASRGEYQNTRDLTSSRTALEKSSSSPPAFASHRPRFTDRS